MLVALKLFGIEVQAYHGGSLHGMDVQKLMSNASNKFKSFADTLKKCKKDDCKLRDKEIDDICQSYANLCVLWDGAFSYASKKGPMKNDIVMYQRFVTAAVHSHVALGLNVTPKVHLMWRHVARQMQLTGGLGYKREDWVEKGHQTSSETREQHRHNVDVKKRAISMARLHQQQTDPEVLAQVAEVDAWACTGPRKNYIKSEEKSKQERQETREKVLS